MWVKQRKLNLEGLSKILRYCDYEALKPSPSVVNETKPNPELSFQSLRDYPWILSDMFSLNSNREENTFVQIRFRPYLLYQLYY